MVASLRKGKEEEKKKKRNERDKRRENNISKILSIHTFSFTTC